MKSRLLTLLVILLSVLLLTACPPTPPRTMVPIQITQILEDDLALPSPTPGQSLATDVDFTSLPPGSVVLINQDGSQSTVRIVPELLYPEWDGEAFPKSFDTTLVAGHWKKYLLGPAALEQGYLVDVNPKEASQEGAEIVAQVLPEYDGEIWVDVLWLLQPKDAQLLPVTVQVYTTAGWEEAFRAVLDLAPGVWQGYTIGQASEPGGLVVEVNPLSPGRSGDTLQRFMINPEFPGGWQDALRIQIPPNQSPMQAEVVIYRTPTQLMKTELTPRLLPGEWFTTILGLSEEQSAYVVDATPLSDYDDQVEAYHVQPVFSDGKWFDVLRIRLPADRQPMEVNLRVYAVGRDSQVGMTGKIATPTPDRLATEWAAYIVSAPETTATPTATASGRSICPGALPSRLQVGESGMVSLDPPVANRVRQEPDRDAEILGQIMPGEKFTVLEGPRCADGWTWWRVRSRAQDLEGWSSEGDAATYWLQPVPAPTPTATPTTQPGKLGCYEAPSGLVSWWTGDSNTDDIQGLNDGTSVNGMRYAAGKVGMAFGFDGQNYIQAPTKGLPTGKSDRTIEFWANVTTFGQVETFFVGYGKFLSFEQTFHLGTTGKILFFSQWGRSILGPAIQPGNWIHLAASNTGNTVTLYFDGKAVATDNMPLNTLGGTQFYIGRLPDSPDKRLSGLIDEVSVYNRALSAAEIKAIYQAGSQGKCKPEAQLTQLPSPTATKPAILPSITPAPGKPTATNTPAATSTPVISGAGSLSPRAASIPLHLVGDAWSGIFLGETNYPWGYLVDVNPLQPAKDGDHLETYIQTWFDGTYWMDYLFVGLPHPESSLDVQVDIYITQDWPVANRGKMSLPAAEWHKFYLGDSSQNSAYVLDINPLAPAPSAVTIVPSLVMPEFSDGAWRDRVQLRLVGVKEPLEAEIIAYKAPDLPLLTEFQLHLEPGIWHGVGLAASTEEQAYLVQVDPITPGREGDHLQRISVQPEFDGKRWNDVLRMMIPEDQPALDVRVRVYTIKP
jgi:hypothetical protein